MEDLQKVHVSYGDLADTDKFKVGLLHTVREPQDVYIEVDTARGTQIGVHLTNATSDGHRLTGYVSSKEAEFYIRTLVNKHNG